MKLSGLPTISKTNQSKIRSILKKHDHKDVEGLKLATKRELAESAATMHGVTVGQIRTALEI